MPGWRSTSPAMAGSSSSPPRRSGRTATRRVATQSTTRLHSTCRQRPTSAGGGLSRRARPGAVRERGLGCGLGRCCAGRQRDGTRVLATTAPGPGGRDCLRQYPLGHRVGMAVRPDDAANAVRPRCLRAVSFRARTVEQRHRTTRSRSVVGGASTLGAALAGTPPGGVRPVGGALTGTHRR